MPLPPTVTNKRYVLLVLDDESAAVAALLDRLGAEQAMAADVVACATPDQVHARLSTGRLFSALLVGAGHPSLDGAVLQAAARAATPVLAVGDEPCIPLGVTARLASSSSSESIVAVLRSHVDPIRQADGAPRIGPATGLGRSGRLLGVCGPGGTGASLVAITLAAGLGRPPVAADVLLADFALWADQALLHQLPDPPIGLLDVVDRCRYRAPDPTQLRADTIALAGYRLLTGLRRPAHWTAVSPRAFDAALDGFCAAFEMVVADLTGDFQGEADVGSIDVEERNHMARRVTAEADAVVVVGRPGRVGTRRLTLTVDELLDHGVDPARILPVFNQVACHEDLATAPLSGRLCGVPSPPIVLPSRVGPELARLPAPGSDAICAAVMALLDRLAPPLRRPAQMPVVVGSVGSWSG